MRRCPVANCDVSGSISEIHSHLVDSHAYKQCHFCSQLMHQSSITRHQKSCSKRAGKLVPKAPCETRSDWTRLQTMEYVQSLNDAGGQRWAIRSSSSSTKRTEHVDWKCFWIGCPGKYSWCRTLGFRRWNCADHPLVPPQVERLPHWLVNQWKWKSEMGVRSYGQRKSCWPIPNHYLS